MRASEVRGIRKEHTDVMEYVEMSHCNWSSSMCNSWPMVGRAIATAVALAVYHR